MEPGSAGPLSAGPLSAEPGSVEPGSAGPLSAGPLSVAARARYARHLLLPEIGESGQRNLTGARVLVIGAGGLGSVTATYLAAAGVGTLGIVDDDVVDVSNLQRQVIHATVDVGRPKVDSAADRIAAINPLVRVERHQFRLTASNARQLVAAYDLVVDGADNFGTRYVVGDACALTGRPHVWGSIHRFDGQVSVWWPPHGPCYRCVFPLAPPPGTVPSCGEAGVLGSLCAAIGSVQATEAIKLLTGAGRPLVGRLLLHDALAQEWSEVPVRANPDCDLCGSSPTIIEPTDPDASCAVPANRLTAAQVHDLLAVRAAGSLDFDLIDVREPHEWVTGTIPGALLISLAELEHADLDPARRLVLYCAAGGRSQQALAALEGRGFDDVADLVGGVSAWRSAGLPLAPPR